MTRRRALAALAAVLVGALLAAMIEVESAMPQCPNMDMKTRLRITLRTSEIEVWMIRILFLPVTLKYRGSDRVAPTIRVVGR